MLMATDPASGDDALMALIAERDAGAFRAAVDAHGPRAHRIAYRMLADATEAEDVAQDVMLRLWDHAGRWRPGGPGIAAWVTRVASNACLDRLRRRRFVSGEALPERIDETPLADAEIEAAQARARTIAAVQALPDRQRAAIVLTYYEELSNIAASAVLDMNLKAFESLLLRARAALKKMLVEGAEAA